MTPVQKVEFNNIITEFNFKYQKDKDTLRLGQAFYNYYYKIIYFGPKPKLFYEKNNEKAIKIICEDITKFVKQNY